MKRYTVFTLTFLLVLSLIGCNANLPEDKETSAPTAETSNISEYLIERDGEQYLILPMSKDEIVVYEKYIPYLDDIDLDMLKAAEEKIAREVAQYSETPDLYLRVDEGYLCLYVEVIVAIDPPINIDHGDGSFSVIDHDHKFFGERITP